MRGAWKAPEHQEHELRVRAYPWYENNMLIPVGPVVFGNYSTRLSGVVKL